MPKYLDLDGLSYFWDKITSKFVAKETGKGLSTNDFTTALKTKVENSASESYVDTAVSNLKNYKSIVVTSTEQGTSFLLTATKNDDKVGVNLADNISVTQGTGDFPNMTISVDADENVIESISVNGSALTPVNKAVDIPVPQYVTNGNSYKINDFQQTTINNVSGVNIYYDDGSLSGSTEFLPDITGMTYASQQILMSANSNASTLVSSREPTSTPLMDGTASIGSGNKFAYEDHVHPTDTSRQATLVSGTNIKTINNQSLLGSGNITIQGGGGEANVIENVSVNGVTGTISNKVASVTVDASDIEFDDQTGWYTGTDVDSALYEVAMAKQNAIEVITKSSSDTSVTLVKDKFFVFPTMTTLSVTVTATGMYTFRFTSGSTATTLTVTGATMPDSFTVEANKVYEVNIYQGYGVASSWTVS